MRNDVTLRDMTTYEARALDAETWADFEKLADANNGVWGGCWCTWYHAEHARGGDTPGSRRNAKAQLVRDAQPTRHCPIGASPASSQARGIAVQVRRQPRSKARSNRSRSSAEGLSRVIRTTRKADGVLRFFSMARYRRSNVSASSGHGRSASTSGWSPAPSGKRRATKQVLLPPDIGAFDLEHPEFGLHPTVR